MKKVQEELRIFGGQKDFLDEEDLQKCIYLNAVIKETFRLYPVPLLMPKETNEKSWENPQKFYPERFLESSIDVKGQDFELIPFGAGRRICPGMHMGLAALELILGNLLYSFDWELPEGVKNEDVDIESLPGLAPYKKNPLYLIARTKMELNNDIYIV
ncbi:hypothetical protein PIB30_060408 [Stylosanthes scabra]|uniref:Cytochrome P450 n=1 Tax=Stylosanthes scabra TaxID=79078 RepID=A0ABU6QK83_9FABA|nr:hypothetical protein [Stylosanthes scabra]